MLLWDLGPLNIKMLANQYRNSHYKDKIVSWLSYLYDGNPHSWKYHLYIETGPWLYQSKSAFYHCTESANPCNIKIIPLVLRITIRNIGRWWDCLIFMMGIPMGVRHRVWYIQFFTCLVSKIWYFSKHTCTIYEKSLPKSTFPPGIFTCPWTVATGISRSPEMASLYWNGCKELSLLYCQDVS